MCVCVCVGGRWSEKKTSEIQAKLLLAVIFHKTLENPIFLRALLGKILSLLIL